MAADATKENVHEGHRARLRRRFQTEGLDGFDDHQILELLLFYAIPRRDTNSWFNKALGGRVFPGIFNRSLFEVREESGAVSVRIVRGDGGEEVAFSGRSAERMPTSSIFPSLAEAAGFFSLGATGYSATHCEGHYHGMELKSLSWSIEPLEVIHARSCFFDDADRFPAGSVELDCALVMREIDHEWHSRPDLYSDRERDRLTKRRR